MAPASHESSPSSLPEPGWYTDPSGVPDGERWWDGKRWTDIARVKQPELRDGMPPAAQQSAVPTTNSPTPPDAKPEDAPTIWSPPATVSPVVDSSRGTQASVGRRALARIIDVSIVWITAWAIGSAQLRAVMSSMIEDTGQSMTLEEFTALQNEMTTNPAAVRGIALFVGSLLLLSAVYTVLFLKMRGATPGKTVLGIKVASRRGAELTWGQSIRRWLIGEVMPLLLPYLLGYLVLLLSTLFHPKQRSLCDLVAQTRVEKSR